MDFGTQSFMNSGSSLESHLAGISCYECHWDYTDFQRCFNRNCIRYLNDCLQQSDCRKTSITEGTTRGRGKKKKKSYSQQKNVERNIKIQKSFQTSKYQRKYQSLWHLLTSENLQVIWANPKSPLLHQYIVVCRQPSVDTASVNRYSIQESKKDQITCTNSAFLGEKNQLLRQLANYSITAGVSKTKKRLLKKSRNSTNNSVLKSEMV